MGRLTWLPTVLRQAGLTVHEQGGWQTRGSAEFSPRGIICHETRGSTKSTDAGEIHVLLNGSATAPPPIAQLYLSRSGEWWVIASGRCNHVKTGWAGPFKGLGNSNLIGIEAQHAQGEPWSARQYDSYVRGVAAIREHTGWDIAGHKEHQPSGYAGHTSIKTDPAFDMRKFRQDVEDVLKGDDMAGEGPEILELVRRIERRGPDWHLQDQGDKPRSSGDSYGWTQQRALLEAILAAVRDDADTASILARIDDVAASSRSRDEELRLLVEQGTSGSLDAAEVVRLIGEKLSVQ